MKANIKKLVKRHIAVLLIGFVYLFIVLKFRVRIPCPINFATGLLCPACGITRMFASLAKLDFLGAFNHNPVIFASLPLLFAVYITELVRYVKYGKVKLLPFSNIMIYTLIIILIAFGILRNII